MALFGKKAQDATLDPSAGASDGSAAGNGAAPAKRGKKTREPKPTKNKVLKNGVAVGLNIGNSFIKAVEVTSKNGELSVTAVGVIATPPESYVNGNVLSISALTGAIKDLWRIAGIKSKVAITSVAGTGSLVVRVIEVPKMTDGELSDNMKVDADRYIPFPPSEVVMDFKALRDLPSDPDAPNMEVLLAAAQREVIDLHIKVVQNAKLDPRAIDVEPIAATRALQLEKRGANELVDYNEVTGLVNLGATGAEISILRGDIVVFTRAVPNGGNSVTQAIADGLGLPFSDAETVKIGSADALAPAGYSAATASDDFGFGDSDGGDFDFGGIQDSDPAPVSPAPAASDDPFDLDFFNQGPKNNEPGAGHAQKEGEPSSEPPVFSFDFDAPPASTPAPTPPPASQATPASGFDFDFPTPDAPASAPSAESEAPPAFNFGSSDEFNTEFLPSVDPEASETEEPPLAGSGGKGTAQLGSPTADVSFDAPANAPATPIVSQDFGSAMPSAFDFDNFDLPTTEEQKQSFSISPAPAPPATAAPASPAMPVTFGFEDATIAPPVDAPPTDVPQGISAQGDTSPAGSDFAPEAAGAGDFDLDAIFGAPAVSEVPLGQQAPVSNASMETHAVPESNDFDLDAIGVGTGDDFGMGLAPATDDFDAFGAGLAPSTVSTDAATLYGLIYPSLEELSNEVRRSLEFHLGRYPDATITRLVLLGGGAKLRNLDVFFTQMLGVPTTVANPFAHLSVQTPKVAPEYMTENGPICAIALGLALRDFVD